MNRRLIRFVVLLFSSYALAHGEDKLGPHGGVIRMPGGFHTEVVMKDAKTIAVYLLDAEWKNPSVDDSLVVATFGAAIAKCETKKDHYICSFPSSVNLKSKGLLLVTATRQGAGGNRAEYPTPF